MSPRLNRLWSPLLRWMACWLALPGLIMAAPVAGAEPTELVVATVRNGHMLVMQELSPLFERTHPDIRLKWVVLDEDVIRREVSADVAQGRTRYDVVTIGMYEAPIWGRKGWLRPFEPDAGYDLADLLPSVRQGLSVDGKLYAAPFYGESSMLMYRRDLLQRAGVSLPYQPTWQQVRDAAAKTHDPKSGVYGICLRGKPGWGDNMALLTTMVNTFGGQWFDMDWRAQIDTPAWRSALGLYLELLQRHGPPGAAANSFNENLALFNAGKCAMWVDATIAASFVTDPQHSKVSDQVGFAQAPTAVTPRGANWLWAWALAMPASTPRAEAATRFISWATSRAYIELVARHKGWLRVPTGTRTSTYRRPEFFKAAVFSYHEAVAIAFANPTLSTLPKSPYLGIQFAAIPEFAGMADAVGQHMAAALEGRITLDQALAASQAQVQQTLQSAGYRRRAGAP